MRFGSPEGNSPVENLLRLFGLGSEPKGRRTVGPRSVGRPLGGRALRRAQGHRLPVDLDTCKRKYSHGRRGARAAAKELRKMTRSDVLDLDRANVLVDRMRDLRMPRG